MPQELQPEPQHHPTITLTRENIAHYRSEFARLSRQYAKLAWAPSASAQRERAALQKPLMELYRAFHPDSTFSQFDDFDVVVRGSRRTE
jgi:hypothetical protein